MSSLIFRRDVESPFFKKTDAIVSMQSYQITEPPLSSVRSNPGSQLNSPRINSLKKAHENALKLQLQKHEISFPKLGNNSSNVSPRESPRNTVVSISSLYSKDTLKHSKSTSLALPQLSCRDFDSPVLTSFRGAGIQNLEEENLQKSQSIKETASKNFNTKKDPYEHKKLMQYLEFLDKNNSSVLKETLIKKTKKSGVGRSKRSLDISHSSQVTNYDSLPSFVKETPTQKTSSKVFNHTHTETNSLFKANSNLAKKVLTKMSGEPLTENPPSVTKDRTSEIATPRPRMLGRTTKQNSTMRVYRNNYEAFFKVLAQNLNELYSIYMNEKKVQSVLDKLARKDSGILEIISSKIHKIAAYDTNKLEQRFALVEVVHDNLSIPMKLEKMKQGLILIEPLIIKELQSFNERLETLIIKKKRDQLKLIEDRLIQSEENLKNICLKRLNDVRLNDRMKHYQDAKDIINERPQAGYYHFCPADPVTIIENHQQIHGDLKNIKLKNLEHARGLTEIFYSWRKHIA